MPGFAGGSEILWGGRDDVVEDGVGEDDEGGLACFGGFGFAPFAEAGFEGLLRGSIGGLRLAGLAFVGSCWRASAELDLLDLAEGSVGFAEEDAEVVGFVAGAAFVGEAGALEGDLAAFGVGEGVGVELYQAGAGEGVEVGVELFAVDAEGEFGVELAGGFGLAAVEGAEDVAELAVFLLRGCAEGLSGGVVGGAEVAVAAGAQAVGWCRRSAG